MVYIPLLNFNYIKDSVSINCSHGHKTLNHAINPMHAACVVLTLFSVAIRTRNGGCNDLCYLRLPPMLYISYVHTFSTTHGFQVQHSFRNVLAHCIWILHFNHKTHIYTALQLLILFHPITGHPSAISNFMPILESTV